MRDDPDPPIAPSGREPSSGREPEPTGGGGAEPQLSLLEGS
jgi:hypothetical protein